MEITWFGHSFVRVRDKSITIAVDPYSPTLGLSPVKVFADVVLITHKHENHSYLQAIKGEYKLIDGPGEYEIKEAFITGFATYHDSKEGQELGKNTVYVVELDRLRICHLGDLGHLLDEVTLEQIGEIDVLLIPVGGGNSLKASEAAEVIGQIEPKIVVPIHYSLPGIKVPLDPVEKFLKEVGSEQSVAQPRLNIASAPSDDTTRFVVLEAAGGRG
jgi:L-ascorbate metabolism protein UlaG (beta-lactamase superfamily)